MRFYKLIIIALALLASPAYAVIFELPIIYEEQEIGFVATELDGDSVVAVDAPGFAEAMGGRLDADLRALLHEMSMIHPSELQDLGIEVGFRYQNMDLVVRLSHGALGTTDIDFSYTEDTRGTHVEEGSWSLLSNFHFAAEENLTLEETNLMGDWIGAANIGGTRGLNLTWSVSGERVPERYRSGVYRNEVTAFHDVPSLPLRISAGDVVSRPSGHLASIPLGGVSMASTYEELQPTRRISPGATQQLLVRERAEVEIYLNGLVMGRYRLPPGRYDLTELPLGEGANEVEVILYYASGEQEIQRFSQFYNAQLLRPGLLNMSLAAGYPSYRTFEGIEYVDDPVGIAFFDYGLTNWLTLGVSGQTSDFGDLYGATAVLGTFLGNVGLRYSQSEALGVEGTAASIEWRHRFFFSDNFGNPNIRILHEEFDNFNNTPWMYGRYLDGTRTVASYRAHFGEHFQLLFSYLDNRTRSLSARREEEIQAIYRWRGIRLGAGVRRTRMELDDIEDTEGFFTVDITLFSPGNGHRFRASHNSFWERSQIEVARVGRNNAGELDYQLGHLDAPFGSSTYGNIGYNGNRGRVGAYAESRTGGLMAYDYAGVQASTAMGWANGRFGWGRAGSAPFTVVSPHPSLDDAQIYVNETIRGSEAIATKRAGALLTARPRNQSRSVLVNVPDAPIGYDWGEGIYRADAGSITGTSIIVGSDESYSVIGSLLTSAGAGVELAAGRIEGEGISQTIFTNRTGRFVVEGLRPGTYRIELMQQPAYQYEFTLEEDAESLTRMGELRPVNTH